MTQIAATIGSIGAKGHHAGKAHGAAGGNKDFAALAAGLGLPTGEGETGDADALALTGEGAGTGEEAKGEGETGTPVVIDLSLTAAAQSAVVDVVAAQPQAVTPPPTEFAGKYAAKDDAIALDGRATGRTGWRMLAAAAPATQETTEAASDTPATTTDLPATDISSLLPKEVKPTAHEAKLARQAAQVKTETEAQPDTRTATTATETAPTTAEAVQTAMPGEAKPIPPRAIRTGVQTGAALRQAVTPSTASDMLVTAHTDAQAAPIFTALPQAQAAAVKAAPQPIVREAGDPATETVTDTATAATQTAITGAPVMSALQRATPEGHATRHQPTTETTIAPLTGRDARTAQDQGKQQDKDGQSAASAALNDNQSASTTDSASGSSNQFTDILQNLPPIAQSRMGVVADASPIVTGPTDVGATLQGQAIDMGVEGQWIDRMAQEITALAAGNGHSRFQLSPPNLGKIQIDVWHGENGGQVQLLTETDEAAQRLREGKHGLEADARLASLSLNSITIERAAQGFDSGNDAQPQPQQQGNQRHPQQGSEQASGQSNSSLNAQTGQGDGRQGQSAAQANAQGNGQGQQNSSGQGKSSINRDVIQDRAGTMAQDGNGRRDGDRVVRYA